MEPSFLEGDWGSNPYRHSSSLVRRGKGSLIDEGMKGGADPLLSQEPASVLPSYASLMDTDVGHDFSDDKLMKSGNLYSLYLLNSDLSTGGEQFKMDAKPLSAASSGNKKDGGGDSDEEIDVETDGGKAPSPVKSGVVANGHYDALFEGMPFTELKGKEVGPCSYCNLWRTIRFMSYCGRFPFCSVYCTKKFAVYKRERGELSEKTPEDIKAFKKLKVPTLFEKHKPVPLFPSSKPQACTNGTLPSEGDNEIIKPFDWAVYLEELNMEAAPVKCFHHAPLAKVWKANLIGALVEVQNRDPGDTKDCFWIARVIKVAGYKAKLRFEGNGMDNSHDFWIHLCKAECYPVNGAEKNGKKLKPPNEVLEKLGSNWREHTTRVAHSGSPTFTIDKEKLAEDLGTKFKKDMQLEVIYKRQVSSTCVATVKSVVADRIYVQYENCKDESKDFWFHHTSPMIHPVGWSQRVHHLLIATAAYKAEALDKGRKKKGAQNDAPWEIFDLPKPIPDDQNFYVSMKLEAIDPLKLGRICVATVVQTLGDGYLMIAIDGCLHDVASWFCYHATSPSLLPVGFCEHHQIDLVPPRGYGSKFDWDDYLKESNSIAAPVELFHQRKVDPSFRVGQKVEAVDLIESGYICAAGIRKIAGPLLRINFDGWDQGYDQWIYCQSPDIYPVGWCEMVGYPLQPPRVHDPADQLLKSNKKHKNISGLHLHENRKRSISGSSGSVEPNKSLSSVIDSIYSFSDTEKDHNISPPRPTKVLKKDKTDRSNKKERKSTSSLKGKNSKTKSHSKSKHKIETKTETPSASHPSLAEKNTDVMMSEAKLSCEDTAAKLSESESLSNGTTVTTSPDFDLRLDSPPMSSVASILEGSVLPSDAKSSGSSPMSKSDIPPTPAKVDELKNGQLSSIDSSKKLYSDLVKVAHKCLLSKHSGSKHKNKKSKKSKKVRDKDKSKDKKKCKKRDKEKKRKHESQEKNSSEMYSMKFSPEGKTSKLAALLGLPGQINFPDNKLLIKGSLSAPDSAKTSALPTTSSQSDYDPFAFETEQETQERLLAKVTGKRSDVKSPQSVRPVATTKKTPVKTEHRSNAAIPVGYCQISEPEEIKSNPFPIERTLLSTPPVKQDNANSSTSTDEPQSSHEGSPIQPGHSNLSCQHSGATTPKTTPLAPGLMELRKLPLNLYPYDAQHLMQSIQWQDPHLCGDFLLAPSHSGGVLRKNRQETQATRHAVPPPVVSPVATSPAHTPEELMLLYQTMLRPPVGARTEQKKVATEVSHRPEILSPNLKEKSFGGMMKQPAVRNVSLSMPDTSSVQNLTDVPATKLWPSPTVTNSPSPLTYPLAQTNSSLSSRTAKYPNAHDIQRNSYAVSSPSPRTIHQLIHRAQAIPRHVVPTQNVQQRFTHPAARQGVPNHHIAPNVCQQLRQDFHKPSVGGLPGTANIIHRLPPLETILKSLNSASASAHSPVPGRDITVNSHGVMQSASLISNRPRLARPHNFPDNANFSKSAVPLTHGRFPSPTSPTFLPITNHQTLVANSSPGIMGSSANHPANTLSSLTSPQASNRTAFIQPDPYKQQMFPTSPSGSLTSCTSSFKLSSFQSMTANLCASSKSSRVTAKNINTSKALSSPTSVSSLKPITLTTPRSRSKPGVPVNPPELSGPGCMMDEFSLKQMPRPEIGIMNPWKWGIREVVQFLVDAGERGCVETFSKQSIDGRKFMSLTKDQIAKLTGMKVAPSLKIYQQIVRLRKVYPVPD